MKKFEVLVFICERSGLEGWDTVEVMADTPEEAWRVAQKNWRKDAPWEPKDVKEID